MTCQLPSDEEIRAVDLSWKRYLLPAIHPEGRKILAAEFLVFGLLGALGFLPHCAAFFAFWGLGAALLVFSFYFFRNPVRVPPLDPDAILAPADGIVSNVVPLVPPPEMGLGDTPLVRVSIFMSVFSVHVNRSPAAGTVSALRYVPGKFLSVQDKDSEDNERQLISLDLDRGEKIGVVQIAGLVARRIFCPLSVGDRLAAGQVFGMIRFGSRLDVFLPPAAALCVRPGQVAVAGETVLARLPARGAVN